MPAALCGLDLIGVDDVGQVDACDMGVAFRNLDMKVERPRVAEVRIAVAIGPKRRIDHR